VASPRRGAASSVGDVADEQQRKLIFVWVPGLLLDLHGLAQAGGVERLSGSIDKLSQMKEWVHGKNVECFPDFVTGNTPSENAEIGEIVDADIQGP
jgi:hypothetical protein